VPSTCACSVPQVKHERDRARLNDPRVIALAAACMIAGFLAATLIFEKPWHLPPNWGDIPTWLAVVIAAVGGWIALSQLRSQQEVLKQDAEDRRRAQAARVFVGAPRDPVRLVGAYAKNASDFPIYEAQLWYLGSGGLSEPDDLGTILPGEAPSGPERYGFDETLVRTILTFRDANSVRWIRIPGGVLEEQSAPTAFDSVLARLRPLPPGTRLRVRAVRRDRGGAGEPANGPGSGGGTGDSSGTGGAGTSSGPRGGGSRTG
jgi:hypothetical protein